MITFLKGRVEKLGPLEAHIEVNGVGYKIHITLSDSEKLALLGDSIVKLYTRTHYTETSRAIYGFLDETMADLYDFLIGLHGIGPRIVMSILSYCQTADFLNSLENGDHTYLTAVPGIGKTKAEKIIFEAKSRQKKLELLKSRWSLTLGPASPDLKTKMDSPGLKQDLFNDLLNQSLEGLGFSPKEIQLAAKKIQATEKNTPDSTMENIQKWVRLYLRHL